MPSDQSAARRNAPVGSRIAGESRRVVRMLGTRGVPASHGGFETAVENIGRELIGRGWKVIVYCQDDAKGAVRREEEWEGFHLIHLPGRYAGAKGTMWFDQLATRDAAKHRDLCITFGYNTAALTAMLRIRGIPSIVNMDGLEWKRARWSRKQQAFLYFNERAAALLADRIIGDHPEISKRLVTIADPSKVATIAYGAPQVLEAPATPLEPYGVQSGQFLTLIARPVPENSVLEVVRAFSTSDRGIKLLVLGNYDRADGYQAQVLDAAGDDVVFAGAVYDQSVVQALRFHSLAYVHGHTVGGTNPSLVEALGCGNAVLAHDNVFNRWVAADAACYFTGETDLAAVLDSITEDPTQLDQMRREARKEHGRFTWEQITDQYEELMRELVPVSFDSPNERSTLTGARNSNQEDGR